MKTDICEISARTILSKSGIPGMKYCVNPYVGCTHACRYCYATFMKRFTGHTEPWGSFVDIKVNAPELLRKQLKRAARGTVMMSSVTDPYQPVEARYQLARKCLEALALYQFPVGILTKSPLVTRDLDIISGLHDAEVGLTVTTDSEQIRKIFEPGAPPVSARIEALKKLHKAGIDTYVFIGPLLPMDPLALARKIKPHVNRVIIDRMNYTDKTRWIYRKNKMEQWLDDGFVDDVITELKRLLSPRNVEIC